MTIQWFPGHMNKSKKAISDLISDIDIVIELLDSRAPFSSCNPLLQSITKYKKKICLLNKSDLSDERITKLWVNFFTQQTNNAVILGSKNNFNQRNQIIQLCKKISPHRNSYEKPLRVIITGIPNVGKSTLINQLIGKKSAKTADIPATTKSNQWLTVANDFLIYDTPGMTWQKIHHPHIGFNLALCNSIGRNALDEEILALYLLDYLKQRYPIFLYNRYKINPDSIINLENHELLDMIAIKRGCLMPGKIVNIQKVSELIIQDFRDGRIGKISLETPNLWKKWQQEILIEESIENEDNPNLET